MAITTNKQLSLTPQKTPALQARGGSFKWSRDSSPVLSQSPININEKSANKCGQAPDAVIIFNDRGSMKGYK